ncbi:MAG: BREX-1 system adenine-specific DNA-methyltransferase PglX [Bryobacteraceae bacterium]|nr:BREX-1 system adenine-specific DNA-methyltransferase PglX [Bryobacteraceae bacterium]MDW8380236.1 hypothetical protein [Bryobacterales bacterium]
MNQHLQQAAKRLETLKNQLQSEIQRSQTPARTSSEAEAATSAGQDEELRRQLLELRQELNFAEAVHHQAAMLLQGWAQTLAEQLQLDLATSYGQEMSPHTRFEELLAGNPRRPLAVG